MLTLVNILISTKREMRLLYQYFQLCSTNATMLAMSELFLFRAYYNAIREPNHFC